MSTGGISPPMLLHVMASAKRMKTRVLPPSRFRFDRREIGGAFGDIGTDLPLLAGMVLLCGFDAAGVLIFFGAAQLFSACVYGIPMPVQPLKVVAALAIAQQLPAGLIQGAGLSVGIIMLALVLTGMVSRLNAIIPGPVILGLQFGLGLKLIQVAAGYAGSEGLWGMLLALIGGLLVILLRNNRRCPPALLVIGLGMLYAMAAGVLVPGDLLGNAGFVLPSLQAPVRGDVLQGFLLLGIAQIPISLGNSIFATGQIAADLYPDRSAPIRKIGLTYALMNLISPFFGGIPVCHGSGGMLGMHFFGARTGGAPFIYGMFFLLAGLCFSGAFASMVHAFPLPVLGVLLFFEGLALVNRLRETFQERISLATAFWVGIAGIVLPYGFLIAMLFGSMAYFLVMKQSAWWLSPKQPGEVIHPRI